ncbi:MAG: hypothetical protein U0556_00315 [Dehalococcoidia bacterium]
MELRQYWAIFRRWFWIPLGLAVLAGGLSVLLAPKPQTTYSATSNFIVSVPPEPRSSDKFAYEGYYAWVASEYLVDDLAELVKTQAFVEDVAREINDPTISVGQIKGQQSTRRTHRILSVTVSGPDSGQVERISNAIATVLNKNSSRYIAQLSLGSAQIQLVDPPVVSAQVSGLRGNLDIVVRAGLGFAAGMAIMLLLAYLDNKIHDGAETEKLLGLPVLGEIPREKRRAAAKA